ncbi:MAG: HAMP domain-containing sensor histidine kinase [Pseudomonadota bacterium]
MNPLRPRSLSALVLLGLAIFVLPLVGALVTAGLQMRQLAATSEHIVATGMVATRLTHRLFAETTQLERQLQFYAIVQDPPAVPKYEGRHEAIAGIAKKLDAVLQSNDARQALKEFARLHAKVGVQSLVALRAQDDAEPLKGNFAGMYQALDLVSDGNAAQVDAEMAALRTRTQRVQTLLTWGSILLLPLTAMAILLFSLRVGRPLRQIDRAISELGSGALHRPIAIRGPADLEKLGRQAEWLRLRLIELAHERSRFLRHMSHELKTPLANIREGTELLMDGAVGELQAGQREVTGILRENGLRLQRMIENLLSFSAWQTSSVGLEITEFRLRPLLKQIIENQQLALLSQRVRLDVNVEDVSIAADRGKLRLIVENLLSNAIKYTPRSGTIHIRARADNCDLVLEVADSGPGIPPEERKQVFEAFYTGKAPAGHIKGTGIGLSVVMEFVNAHGGKIEIVEGQWQGAHFRIRMPLKSTTTETANGTGQVPAGKQAHAA